MTITLDQFPQKHLAINNAQIELLVKELPFHQYTLVLTHNDLADHYKTAKSIEGPHVYKYQMLTDRLIRNAAVVVFVSVSNTCQVLKQNFL